MLKFDVWPRHRDDVRLQHARKYQRERIEAARKSDAKAFDKYVTVTAQRLATK